MAHTIRQVTAVALEVDDRIGMLSQVLRTLKNEGLSMTAIVSQRKAGTALMGIPEDIEAARRLAGREGVALTTREVFYVEGDDEVGALCEITDKLANARINIEDIYALSSKGYYAAIYSVAAGDVERAAQALGL